MLDWLKMHFIPHEGNNHRPHILHQKNIHRIFGLIVFIEVFAFLIPTIALIGNADNGQVLPSVLSELTNKQRETMNLPDLTISPILNEAAQEKADDMAQNGYFAHTSPDGKTPWYWLAQVGYNYSYAGENLAVNFTDSQAVTDAWMNSPTHRANILKANYTQVGTGVAEGMYQGNETIFVAQDFALPAIAQASVGQSDAATSLVANSGTTPAAHNATPEILGAETETAAVVPVVVAQQSQPQVATAPIVHPNIFQRFLASPHTGTNTILFVILAIVALAVFLNIGIKISHHHPDLILNGVMVMATIGCVFVMNNYIANSNTTVIQSVDYTANHTVL
jgi:hypothetical protein